MKLSENVEFSTEEIQDFANIIKSSELLEKEEFLKNPHKQPQVPENTQKEPEVPVCISKPRTNLSDYDLVDQILQTPQFLTPTYKKKDLEKALETTHGRKIKIQQMTWAEDRPNRPAIIFKTDKGGVYKNSRYFKG